MKKITTNTKTLLGAVSTANTYTSKDGDYAGTIAFVGNNGMMEVKATDMMQTIVFKNIAFTSSDLSESGFEAISLDGKKLATVLKMAKSDEVIIEINDDFIIVKSNRSRVKIETMSEAQDISIEKGHGNPIILDECIGIMDSLIHAIDQNNPKYELNGLMLEAKDNKVSMVATDTRRLAVASSDTQMDDIKIIIPKQAVTTIVKLFSNNEIEAESDDVSFSIHSHFVSYSTKLINGKYPDFDRIVPKDFSQIVTLNAKKLVEIIEEAAMFEHNIVFSIKDQILSATDINKNTEAYAEKDETIDIHTDLNFIVHSRYILDFISACKSETVKLSFNNHNIPFALSTDKMLEVIMPVVL